MRYLFFILTVIIGCDSKRESFTSQMQKNTIEIEAHVLDSLNRMIPIQHEFFCYFTQIVDMPLTHETYFQLRSAERYGYDGRIPGYIGRKYIGDDWRSDLPGLGDARYFSGNYIIDKGGYFLLLYSELDHPVGHQFMATFTKNAQLISKIHYSSTTYYMIHAEGVYINDSIDVHHMQLQEFPTNSSIIPFENHVIFEYRKIYKIDSSGKIEQTDSIPLNVEKVPYRLGE